jgi:single-stranded-DNA-specific exonuclease
MRLPPRATDDARALARELGVSATAGAVLARRGHVDPERATKFFDPKLADLTPPFAMRDRTEAVERIARAVRKKERVCVFGDYDADGVTSAALLTSVLRALGADVATRLADRFDGGYGLSAPALARVLETGATLLVTCDCGSSDHERLHGAHAAGLDAVVIDHHRVPEEPLPAFAFLNPHRPECGFPYKGLASVGLALSIAAGVRRELAVDLDLRWWLDLVAVGTIGDVAPLDGDNRALVRAGLALLARGARPGTRALAEVCGYTGAAPITGEDVAFRFAPRINAPGRLAQPDLALELLLTASETEARVLAAKVDAICQERKVIERAVLAEALAMLADPAFERLPVVVLAKEGWHPGVVGIVAGRLASQTKKPTIVIALEGAAGRGSVRGPAGFPLHDALARSRDALLGFGGHQAAAGVHVAADRVHALRDRFADAYVALAPSAEQDAPAHDADAVLEESDAPWRVLQELERFEPCGASNPAPRIALEGARVLKAHEVRGGHLRLYVEAGGARLSCFGPELGREAARLGARAHVIGRLRRDTYHGGGAVEMRVESVEPA